jgi:hypothetical protein
MELDPISSMIIESDLVHSSKKHQGDIKLFLFMKKEITKSIQLSQILGEAGLHLSILIKEENMLEEE